MDVSITPRGSEASRIDLLILFSACLFSSQKINECALIQLEGKKKECPKSLWSPYQGNTDVK